jgi:hypothetical protein
MAAKLLAVCACLAQLSGASVPLKNWFFLGPFTIGKTEIDADPLESFGHLASGSGHACTRLAILRKAAGCPSTFYSELVDGGVAGWSKPPASPVDGGYQVVVQFPMSNASVNFNTLVQGMNKISVLEFQGWATVAIPVKTNGAYEIQCSSIHSFFVDDQLYAGDVYSQGLAGAIVHLKKGTHYLDIRIRAKAQQQFRCSVKPVQGGLRLGVWRGSEPTDIVAGAIPLHPASWMQLPLTNLESDWATELTALITVEGAGKTPRVIAASEPGIAPVASFDMLAPAHTQFFPFQFKLVSNGEKANWWERFTSQDAPCLVFGVQVKGRVRGAAVTSNTARVSLRCRHSLQSFLFTLPDHDGSITHAAAIKPISSATAARRSFPVLLTLSGVGVTARAQADSYKYKQSPRDKDYIFGMDSAWVLAPHRDGAHNWEGTGFWSAVAALEYLGLVTADGPVSADISTVVAAGHSRGGHGVLTLSTHMPSRVLAVATASGYPDRESYGDANILFDVDLQLAHMDPALLSVMLATIHEHDNLQSAVNLREHDVLVRTGGQDLTVSPFFQRQIARALAAVGVNITYSEKAGADHWYWDFDAPEDGGVVFDPLTRLFFHEHLFGSSKPVPESFEFVSWNAATFEGWHGVHVMAMISRLKKAKVVVTTSVSEPCSIVTANVARLRIEPSLWTAHPCVGGLFIGGVPMDAFARSDAIDFCLAPVVPATKPVWGVCAGHTRGPHEYGPARQAFQAPFVIVVGSGQRGPASCAATGDCDERDGGGVTAGMLMNAARYISVGHLSASSTVARIVLDSDVTAETLPALLERANLVLVGGPEVNSVSQLLVEAGVDLPPNLMAMEASIWALVDFLQRTRG